MQCLTYLCTEIFMLPGTIKELKHLLLEFSLSFCSYCERGRMTRKAIFTIISVRKTVHITTTLKSLSIQIIPEYFLAEINTSISLKKKYIYVFTCWESILHQEKNNRSTQGKNPIYPSEAYPEWDFQCFDHCLHEMGLNGGSKRERACSDVLFCLHTLLNFHLLECAFNAFLTNDFWLVGSLGIDVRCRDTHFLLLCQKGLNHRMLLCVYWTAMLTANVRYQIHFSFYIKWPIFNFHGETKTCLIEIFMLSQYANILHTFFVFF